MPARVVYQQRSQVISLQLGFSIAWTSYAVSGGGSQRKMNTDLVSIIKTK